MKTMQEAMKIINTQSRQYRELLDLAQQQNDAWAEKAKLDFYKNHNAAMDKAIEVFVKKDRPTYDHSEVIEILYRLKYEDNKDSG